MYGKIAEELIMIKDVQYYETWERQWKEKEGRLPYDKAIRMLEALWQEGLRLGVLPPSNPLDGIETEIRIARILNGCSKNSSKE